MSVGIGVAFGAAAAGVTGEWQALPIVLTLCILLGRLPRRCPRDDGPS